MKKKKKGWDGSCKGGGTPERSASYSSSTSAAGSVRREYETHGVKDFYANFGGKYVNPHDAAIQRVLNIAMKKWVTATANGRKAGDDVDSKCTGGGGGGAKVVLGKITSVLDLACGSGEATIALQKYLGKAKCNFTATDPYTFKAYAQRTGMEAEKYSFKDIANGCYSEKRFDLVISSFALHLASKSMLWAMLSQLSELAPFLVVLTPHKRPDIPTSMGWELVEEVYQERIRCRLYRSLAFVVTEGEEEEKEEERKA